MNLINERPYQQCTRCVMDTTAVDITFDELGNCIYCTEFIERSNHTVHEKLADKEIRLKKLVELVKDSGKGKPYDCIVGVSGGVDSSWTLVEVKRLGLRPLAVHMDNGWNSELAQNNIANLLRRLDVDLHTHVIDWDEYRGFMQAFFDADVIDVELLYDNAMLAVNYQQCAKYGLKYILAGTNLATEGMRMPYEWNWLKFDKRNIKAIARRHGIKRNNTFPMIGTAEYIWYHFVRGIRWTSFLDYLPYNKFQALDELEKQYEYKRYPFKHYESVFTRFYQGYILPGKFGVDKRKIHLSTLVASGQLTREDALKGIDGVPYSSEADMRSDVEYFLKKMKWTQIQFQEYMCRPKVSHDYYQSERRIWNLLRYIYFSLLSKERLGNSND
jgi:N-acetyl sugar amidotransferase